MVKLEKSNDHNTEDYVFSYSNTRVYFSPNFCRKLLISIYNSYLNTHVHIGKFLISIALFRGSFFRSNICKSRFKTLSSSFFYSVAKLFKFHL